MPKHICVKQNERDAAIVHNWKEIDGQHNIPNDGISHAADCIHVTAAHCYLSGYCWKFSHHKCGKWLCVWNMKSGALFSPKEMFNITLFIRGGDTGDFTEPPLAPKVICTVSTLSKCP